MERFQRKQDNESQKYTNSKTHIVFSIFYSSVFPCSFCEANQKFFPFLFLKKPLKNMPTQNIHSCTHATVTNPIFPPQSQPPHNKWVLPRPCHDHEMTLHSAQLYTIFQLKLPNVKIAMKWMPQWMFNDKINAQTLWQHSQHGRNIFFYY